MTATDREDEVQVGVAGPGFRSAVSFPSESGRCAGSGWRRRVVALAVVTVGLLVPGGGLPASNRTNQEARRREVSEELRTVKVRLVTISSQYEELKRQSDENVELKQKLEQELAAFNLRHARAVEGLHRTGRELREAETEHAVHLERFTRGLSDFYRMKNRPYLAFLINSRDMAEFSRRYKLMQYVFQHDYKELEQIQRTRAELRSKQQELDTARAGLELARVEKQRKTEELAAAIARGEELLASLEKEKQEALSKAQKLQASLEFIDAKLAKLASAAPAEAAAVTVKPLPAGLAVPERFHRTAEPGKVDWPVDTRGEITVVKTYGQSRSDSGSFYFNPGIDIKIASPTGVRAVASGQVMHAGDVPNFGKVVFIDHGGDPDKIISIYGNLDDILVPVGQRVARGDQIGRVGLTASPASDTTLHFEIRKNAVHQDPLHWLHGGRHALR